MDDTTNSEGSQRENSSAENSQIEQEGSLDNKVLDSEGHANTTKRRGRKRKDDWSGEKLIISENGNVFEIRVDRNTNRYYKVSLFLNGMPVKPMTLPGTGPASAYWNLLKEKINEVENHVESL